MYYAKFQTSLPKNKGMAKVFVSPIGGKIQQNVVLRHLKETHTAIKFFLNLWYLLIETYDLLQIAEESSEMWKMTVLKWREGLSKEERPLNKPKEWACKDN